MRRRHKARPSKEQASRRKFCARRRFHGEADAFRCNQKLQLQFELFLQTHLREPLTAAGREPCFSRIFAALSARKRILAVLRLNATPLD